MKEWYPFLIRRMKPADIPAVMALDRIVFSDPWPESVYIKELFYNPKARYFVLYLDRRVELRRRWWTWRPRTPQLLGFVGMRTEGTKGHISTLAVRPEWQGRGLGELLLLTALEQSLADAVRAVTLEVRVSNLVAQRLYQKYRFVRTSRLHGYYHNGEDAFLLQAGPLDDAYRQMLRERRVLLAEKLRTWKKEEIP